MAVRYFVADVEAALRFYRDLLGFEVVEDFGPAIAITERSGQQLWLSGPPASASRPMPNGEKPSPGGWNRVVVEVEDIDATVARLREAGVQFRGELISGPGGSQVLIEDSDGNPVEVFSPR